MDLALWGFAGGTFFMAMLGALLVCLYQSSDDVELSGLLAFNIGASAPLILTSLTSQVPIEHGNID